MFYSLERILNRAPLREELKKIPICFLYFWNRISSVKVEN